MSRFKVNPESGGGSSPPLYYKEGNPAKIDPSSEESLQKWQDVLHLSRRELLDAIENYGTEVRNIRRGLRQDNEVA